MLRSVLVAALVGAAAAFAPARPSAALARLPADARPLSFPAPCREDAAPAPALGLADRLLGASRPPSSSLGMKVVSSIGSLKKRSKTCQVVRRRGRLYVIDKKNPRNNARQGRAKMQKRRFK